MNYFQRYYDKMAMKQEENGVIDWSKIPVDTPIVTFNSYGQIRRGYFSSVQNGVHEVVFAFIDGRTCWSSGGHEEEFNYADKVIIAEEEVKLKLEWFQKK